MGKKYKPEMALTGRSAYSSALNKVLTGAVPVFCAAFVGTLLISSVVAPVEQSSADTTVTANLNANGYHVNITAASAVTMNVNTTPNGAMTAVKDIVKTETNSPSGYKLYLSTTGTSNGLELSTDSSTALSAAAGTLASPAALADNTWGYAIPSGTSYVTTNGFDASYTEMESATPTEEKYAGVPTLANLQLLQSTSAANSTANEMPIYYAVRANMAMPSGAYSNTVTYTAVAEATSSASGEVNIDKPTATSGYDGGETIKLTTTLYTNATLTSDDVDVTIGGKACTVTDVSTANGTLVVTCTTPATEYLGTKDVVVNVAKFGKSYTTTYDYPLTWETMTYMQEMTQALCDSAGTVTTSTASVPEKTLTDKRDSKTYRIRKLADGNCWMTQNLDLALTTGLELNSSNTDISSTWTVKADEATVSTTGTKWGTGDAWNDTAHITDTELNTVHSYNGNGSAGSRTIATNKGNATPATDGSNAVSPVENQSIGTYYNWYAATAKSGTASITTNGAKASDSICPKGWKLPDNDGTKSFKNLLFTTYGLSDNNAASNGKIRSYPLSFVYAGNYRWVNGTVEYQGVNGDWWSSTALSRTNAYYLSITYLPRLIPQNSNVRAYGFSVRCVSK